MEKKRIREIREQIRRVLMSDWDPIGVKDVPEAQDEYDSYVYGLFKLLLKGASETEIIELLHSIEAKDMGLRCNDKAQLALVAEALKHIDVTV